MIVRLNMFVRRKSAQKSNNFARLGFVRKVRQSAELGRLFVVVCQPTRGSHALHSETVCQVMYCPVTPVMSLFYC